MAYLFYIEKISIMLRLKKKGTKAYKKLELPQDFNFEIEKDRKSKVKNLRT